jgi:hypothetical protein
MKVTQADTVESERKIFTPSSFITSDFVTALMRNVMNVQYFVSREP